MYNLIIIGGGVSGLIAAGTAASRGLSVLLLEKMEKPARKLRITGKGRCNITNTGPLELFLEKVRSGSEFVRPALSNFDNFKTVEFFNKIGVKTIDERGGRIFPASGQAREVAENLIFWAEKQGAKIICNSPVMAISLDGHTYTVTSDSVVYQSENVLISTGGVSYPLTGSTGDGLRFANELGHNIVPLSPALVALRIDPLLNIENIALKNTKATLVVDGQNVDERFGDVEFNDRGLGGAAILQLSRSAVQAMVENRKTQIVLDLKSALSIQKITNRITRELEAGGITNFGMLLRKLVPIAMVSEFCTRLQVSPKQTITKVTSLQFESLANLLKNFEIDIVNYGSFAEAIITVGGVSLDDVNSQTMESNRCKGLYFAGEVLDIDADTGGYNIQLAISTAVLAANSINTK